MTATILERVTDWPWPAAPLWASLVVAAAATLLVVGVGALIGWVTR